MLHIIYVNKHPYQVLKIDTRREMYFVLDLVRNFKLAISFDEVK